MPVALLPCLSLSYAYLYTSHLFRVCVFFLAAAQVETSPTRSTSSFFTVSTQRYVAVFSLSAYLCCPRCAGYRCRNFVAYHGTCRMTLYWNLENIAVCTATICCCFCRRLGTKASYEYGSNYFFSGAAEQEPLKLQSSGGFTSLVAGDTGNPVIR